MARARQLDRSRSNSSSSSTSPERGVDDDNDSFMLQANDSQSSLALSLSETDMMTDSLAHDQAWEQRCRVSPIYRLPAELLISIFARISSTKDLQSCMLVSKDWARNSVGLLWHRPSMNNWPNVQNVVKSIRKADKFFAYQDLVKRLNMSTLASQVSDGTIGGMDACKRIERLTLTTCTKLTDVSLAPLINGNRSLVALDVTGIEQLTDRTLMVVAENCLRLQGLNITGCRRLTDASLVAIAKSCRHLKRLKFNSCSLLTDTSILTVAAHSSHLLEIDLYDLPLIESPSVTALLTQCRHLRELRLMRCPRITDAAFANVPTDYRPFDALRILDLTDCVEIGDKAVERIVQTCPRLRNFVLAKCRHLTDRAVYAITKLGKNLHYLHLGHCTRLTDASISALARTCTRIRYIDLACCSNLTDVSITQLATNLPKLKRVGLVKCAGITDRSIHALATYGGRNTGKSGHGSSGVNVLERVHLSYCTLLTLDGIHTLLNNCPRLTHLSLTGVQAFLREDLTVYCREAPPEFNEHQRDVFCVFSGAGVTRLREHLNGIDNFLAPNGAGDSDDDSAPPPPPHHQQQQANDGDDAMDFEDLDDDGEATPVEHLDEAQDAGDVVHVPIHSTPSNNNTQPMIAGSDQTRGPERTPIHQQQLPSFQQFENSASATGHGPALWAGGQPWSLPPTTAAGSVANRSMFTPQRNVSGGASQVTGMMGAAMLDDVDEDLGDDSELMGRE